MFAVIQTGGKQYRVAANDRITVERLIGQPGTMVALDKVLMIGEAGKAPVVGRPLVAKAAVFAEILGQETALYVPSGTMYAWLQEQGKKL
ncbi:MAG: 50S ribosomal protein L21, partial [Pseudomonadota bacterium]